MKKLCAGAVLMSAGLAWGAACETSGSNLGTLWPDQTTTFSARCVAEPSTEPNDPGALSFSHTYNFTLAGAASFVGGGLHLQPTGGSLGNPLYEMIYTAIAFGRDGVWTTVGLEGAGTNEYAGIYAYDMEAGDYTMRISGHVFDFGARAGRYSGFLNVSYLDPSIAAPVPEPETLALLVLGFPLAVAAARRRRKEAATL